MSCRDKRGCAGRKSQLHIEKEGTVGVQYFFSDLLPYNARHLITIEFGDQVIHHDLPS
jgi:hypothetical protein